MTDVDGFDWFTGLASVAAPCPPALLPPHGLQSFFAAPNQAGLGAKVPRVLMHECLHAFQLAGSSWLQRLVAEEWERVLALERTGRAPSHGPLRRAFGRPAPGQTSAVRDVVECLARFWDMHIRGPDRVLAEEGFPDPDGHFAALRAERCAQGVIPYTSEEYDAAMTAGAAQDSYPRLYLKLLHDALASPAVKSLGQHDPAHNAGRATWAVNVVLPIAGFMALNTSDPVRALQLCMEAVLGDERGLRLATVAGNTEIALDQLCCWSQLVGPLSRVLAAAGLAPTASLSGPVEVEGWREHPVWRHLTQRCAALCTGLRLMLSQSPPTPDPRRPWLVPQYELMQVVLRDHAFAVFGLMGVPPFRLQLGAAFAPPVLRFSDAQLCATEAAAAAAPWPLTGPALLAAVEEARRRHRALRDADFAAKYGVAPGAFTATSA